MRFVLRKAVLFFLFAAILCGTSLFFSCDSMVFSGYVGSAGQKGSKGGKGEKGDPGIPGITNIHDYDDDDNDEDETPGEVSVYFFLPEHDFILCS
jgi:hypothetical protein